MHKTLHFNLTALTFNKPSLFVESELEISSHGCSWHITQNRNLKDDCISFLPYSIHSSNWYI